MRNKAYRYVNGINDHCFSLQYADFILERSIYGKEKENLRGL